MSKIKRKPKLIKKKKAIWQNLYFRLTILCLILLTELFYLLIFSPIFQIKTLIISAPLQISNNVLQDLVEKTTFKKLLFFPTQSIFLYNSRETQETILQRFSQIELIKIKRNLPGTLVVEMKNRQAVGQWCQKEQCFLVDKQGVLFHEDFATQETPDLLIFSLKEHIVKSGQKTLAQEELEAIGEIFRELNEELGVNTKKFIIASGRLIAKTALGPEIYFDLQGDIPEQLFNLKVLLEKQVSLQKTGLEYIDLRFGNRVFYK